jgi:cytochrome c551/c552
MYLQVPAAIAAASIVALLLPQAHSPQQQAGVDARPSGALFTTSDACIGCHNGLVTPSGQEVSIGFDWRASMMGNSARDPYWQAAVRREVLDHPKAQAAIEHECSACHMPMARFEAKAHGRKGEVFAHLPIGVGTSDADLLAADGTSCSVCHQIEDRNFGARESFTAGFAIDTTRGEGERRIFGPFLVDKGLTTVMRSASAFTPTEALHVQKSEMCATCHTLYTHALGPDGSAIDELPEQVPYLEWLHSSYRAEKSCQSCHMPAVEESTPITGVLGEPRSGFSRHAFNGGNFFMPRMLNRYRNELGVTALSQELETTARRTIEHLQSESATVAVERADLSAGRLRAEVVVANLAGHKLPSAYPSRRAWIHLKVLDRNGRAVFESGAIGADGRIHGNDNDADPSRYEPHHTEITSAGQVQIYEAIMAGPDGAVTTGLLTAVRYVKDNRLLPLGFDKATAGKDIAVRGAAEKDPDFAAGGDRVRYTVPVNEAEGPFVVQAELRYQPIAYRWAQNLRRQPAFETDRFVSYYDTMAGGSSVVLAKGVAVTRQGGPTPPTYGGVPGQSR